MMKFVKFFIVALFSSLLLSSNSLAFSSDLDNKINEKDIVSVIKDIEGKNEFISEFSELSEDEKNKFL